MNDDFKKIICILGEAARALKKTGVNVSLAADMEKLTMACKAVAMTEDNPPAPAVPGEMTGSIAMTQYGIKPSNYKQWVKGFNACRAVMLAQPVSPGCKPLGSWVACSEQMPEPNKYVQVSNGVWVGIGMYNDADNFEDDERWQDEHNEFIDLLHHPVTHWMPLPDMPSVVGAPRADSSKGEGM